MRYVLQEFRDRRLARLVGLVVTVICVHACGYRFGGTAGPSPFPSEFKSVVLESVLNNTTISGIETELTNDLRQEFALGSGLKPVRSGGDLILKTAISSFVEAPSTYKADGKELTRIGTLNVNCRLEHAATNKVIWHKDLFASNTYNVTENIPETLSNRRMAISRMIKDLIPRIHRSVYDNF